MGRGEHRSRVLVGLPSWTPYCPSPCVGPGGGEMTTHGPRTDEGCASSIADGTGWRGGGGVDTDRGGIILGYANKQ